MTKLRQLTTFKGSNFLIPMFLTSVIYTFFPHLLNLGAPFSGFLVKTPPSLSLPYCS